MADDDTTHASAKPRVRELPKRLLRLHRGHLHHPARLVVRRPLADLFAVREAAGPHDGSVLSEPLPVAGHHFAAQLTSSPERSVLVEVLVILCDPFLHGAYPLCARNSGTLGIEKISC